jgi:hypothetical protein
MATEIERLIGRIRDLEDELETQVAARRAAFRYRVERNRIVFEDEIRRRHAALRARLLPYIRQARPMTVLTAPVIYALIVPLLFLDLCVTLYQAVCFPAYGIEKVRRRDFIVYDRRHLAYLNGIEKLNCTYCSYANGLIAYVREIAARTEQYWCPIKHARRVAGMHGRYPEFADFGDAEAYRDELERLRAALRAERRDETR